MSESKHITHDPAYNTVDRDDFRAGLARLAAEQVDPHALRHGFAGGLSGTCRWREIGWNGVGGVGHNEKQQ